ncbi:unnamed protein product [Rotaria magnacalcarata]|uniref:Uncharacterized protein n=1 Tax=Rotaria magnacalcarata TaxID=392030 RepID=A0A816FIL5_9BILA|nr:unnamed protein product [Rotaria magnacalcarata]CAF3788943.1 unnamed protein product [Rotaria magnacalcarata]
MPTTLPKNLEEAKRPLLLPNLMVLFDLDNCLFNGCIPHAKSLSQINPKNPADEGYNNKIDENFIKILEILKTGTNPGSIKIGVNSVADLNQAFDDKNINRFQPNNNILRDRLLSINKDKKLIQFASNYDTQKSTEFSLDNKNQYQTKQYTIASDTIKYVTQSKFFRGLGNNQKQLVRAIIKNTYSRDGNKTDMIFAQVILDKVIREKYDTDKLRINVAIVDNDIDNFHKITNTISQPEYKALMQILNFDIHFIPLRGTNEKIIKDGSLKTQKYEQRTMQTVLANSIRTALENPNIDFSSVPVLSVNHKPGQNRAETDLVMQCVKNQKGAIKSPDHLTGPKIKKLTADNIIRDQDNPRNDEPSMDDLISGKGLDKIPDIIMFPCYCRGYHIVSYDKNDSSFYRELIDKRGSKYAKLFEQYTKKINDKADTFNRMTLLRAIQFLDMIPIDFMLENYESVENFISAAAKHNITENYYKDNLKSVQDKLQKIKEMEESRGSLIYKPPYQKPPKDKREDEMDKAEKSFENSGKQTVEHIKKQSEQNVIDLEIKKAFNDMQRKINRAKRVTMFKYFILNIRAFFGSEKSKAHLKIIKDAKYGMIIRFCDNNYNKFLHSLNIIYSPHEMSSLNAITNKYKDKIDHNGEIVVKTAESEKQPNQEFHRRNLKEKDTQTILSRF